MESTTGLDLEATEFMCSFVDNKLLFPTNVLADGAIILDSVEVPEPGNNIPGAYS